MNQPLTDEECWSLERVGHLYFQRERYDRARAIFEGLTRLQPGRIYPWYALGLIWKKQGDAEQAMHCFDQALSGDEPYPQARVAMAETLLEHGYVRDAVEVLRPFASGEYPESRAVRRGRVLLETWG